MKIVGPVFNCYSINTLNKLLMLGYLPMGIAQNTRDSTKSVWVFKMSEELYEDLKYNLPSEVIWVKDYPETRTDKNDA